MSELQCWKCGASLAELTLPLRRLEECPRCTAELHVCRLCEFYDTQVAKRCREPIAAEVRDKEHANFCDYHIPRPGAWSAAPHHAAAEARTALDQLFGEADEDGDDDPAAALDALFKD